jgi:hypothetical protein
VTCEFCADAFTPRPSMRHKRQRFCSRRCASLARTGRIRGEECTVDGCEGPDRVGGLCSGHAWRLRHWGDVRAGVPLKRQRPRGAGNLDRGGYVSLYRPEHPNAQANGLVMEHRMVMANALGRALLPTERVHHVNGDRTDNRIANLELWVSDHPSGQRPADVVEWATRILARYAPERLDYTYGPRWDEAEHPRPGGECRA